ncbi:MAG: hypothetical protein HZA91_06425 [Verrucomicrobia bacterium]|nr:hypothetical protein [Verrucomicrobiota bacterium]
MAASALLPFLTADAAEQPAADAAAKKLYDTRCIRCHEHHDITVYDDMAWKRLLWKMKDKARLDNEEYGDLSDYLKSVREAARRSRTTR